MHWVLLRLLSFPTFAVLGQILWMTNYAPTDWAAGLIWIPVLAFCWYCVGGISHEIIHDNLRLGQWGLWIGRLIGVVLLIPQSVYREVHMRHHAYLNTPLDWEMWPYTDPHCSLRCRRVFVLFAVFVTPITWGRICFSKYSPVSSEVRRTMKLEYLTCALCWSSVVFCCIWMHTTGRFTFAPEQWIFAAPPLIATIINGGRKLMDHVGTESIDPIHGTRTIVGKNAITRTLSFFNFDLSIHGPHHRFPKLSHTELRNRMGELQAQYPEESYPVFSTYSSAVADTIRRIIANPGVGLNAGCTADLSHLPMDQSACGPFDPQPR